MVPEPVVPGAGFRIAHLTGETEVQATESILGHRAVEGAI